MTTYSIITYGIRGPKTQANQILRELAGGKQVIITCQGKPCGKLMPIPHTTIAKPGYRSLRDKRHRLRVQRRARRGTAGKPALRSLRGLYRGILPHATYEDFQEIKKIWEPRPLPVEDTDAE